MKNSKQEFIMKIQTAIHTDREGKLLAELDFIPDGLTHFIERATAAIVNDLVNGDNYYTQKQVDFFAKDYQPLLAKVAAYGAIIGYGKGYDDGADDFVKELQAKIKKVKEG